MDDTAKIWADQPDLILSQALRHSRLPLCITDPSDPDNPIVFSNAAFSALTGYSHNEIIGRNCRFLQGPGTTQESIDEVRRLISSGQIGTVDILNYRKDGSSFLNALQIGPIMNAEGEITHFFGSQLDVTERAESEARTKALNDAELRHRLQNIVSVLSVLIRLTGRENIGPDAMISEIIARVQAVGDTHVRILTDPGNGAADIGEVIAPIVGSYSPRGMTGLTLDGPAIDLAPDIITPLSLLLHELATNAVKYGAFSTDAGHVLISWVDDDSMLELTWHETGGPEVNHSGRNSGSQIVERLVSAAGGTLSYDWQKAGLIAKMRIPLLNG